jgi:hypothetical protein
MPGGQTHGLLAHRSIGDENGGIGLVGTATRQQLRTIPLNGCSMAAVGRRAVEARRDFADPASLGATPQLRQREPGVAILRGCVRAVDAEMRDPQIVVDGAIPE